MKTLYPCPTAIIVLHDLNKQARYLLAILLLLVFSLQVKAQVIPEVIFSNPTLISGTAGQNGAKYRFPNAATGLDVIVEIKKRSSSNVVINNIDMTSVGWDKALQPEMGIPGTVASNQNWWVEFEATFVTAGTTNKRKVDHFDVTALDVDGDNWSIQEYVQMDKTKNVSFSTVTNLLGGGLIGEHECDMCEHESPLKLCLCCLGLGVNLFLQKCNSCNGTGKQYQDCGHAWDGASKPNCTGPNHELS